MERQLWESVQIANAKFNILYVKETYNRCRIPAIHTEDWKIKNQSKEENGETKQKKARFIPLKAPEAKRARRERINQNTTPEQTMKEPEVQELVCVTTEPEKNIEVPKSTLEVIQSSGQTPSTPQDPQDLPPAYAVSTCPKVKSKSIGICTKQLKSQDIRTLMGLKISSRKAQSGTVPIPKITKSGRKGIKGPPIKQGEKITNFIFTNPGDFPQRHKRGNDNELGISSAITVTTQVVPEGFTHMTEEDSESQR